MNPLDDRGSTAHYPLNELGRAYQGQGTKLTVAETGGSQTKTIRMKGFDDPYTREYTVRHSDVPKTIGQLDAAIQEREKFEKEHKLAAKIDNFFGFSDIGRFFKRVGATLSLAFEKTIGGGNSSLIESDLAGYNNLSERASLNDLRSLRTQLNKYMTDQINLNEEKNPTIIQPIKQQGQLYRGHHVF